MLFHILPKQAVGLELYNLFESGISVLMFFNLATLGLGVIHQINIFSFLVREEMLRKKDHHLWVKLEIVVQYP